MFKFIIIKILALLISMGFAISSVLAAVDWNLDMLGFSSDSNYFVLTESVTDDKTGIASAKIIIAEVATNKCVSDGCLSASGSKENVKTEQEVLKEVYGKTWILRKKLNLTQPQLNAFKTNGPFFNEDCSKVYYSYNNKKLQVNIQQKVMPYRYHNKASVRLQVSMGDITTVLDSLDNYRDYAQKYQLGRLFVSPDKKSIAILLHIFYQGLEGQDVRTIVQTAKLGSKQAVF